jgi:hypothetical protein
MNLPSFSLAAASFGLLACTSLRAKVTDVEDVKTYLVTTVTKMAAAGHAYVKDAKIYAAIIDAYHGDYAKAYAANKPEKN